MINFEDMIKAQKVMWVKRILSDDQANWKAYIRFILDGTMGFELFKCTYKPELISIDVPRFYRQILYAWAEVKSLITPDMDVMNIRREYIWANKNIIIGNEYACDQYKHWFKCGIRQIHDIVDEQENFLDFDVLKEKMSLNDNILKYISLKSAIPREWKGVLRSMKVPHIAISYKEQPFFLIGKNYKPLGLITNRDIYWIFVNSHTESPAVITYWNQVFNIPEDDWPRIFTYALTAVLEPKLRVLQYKILFKIIPCNYYVSHFNHECPKTCWWCPNEIDNVQHYFYHCEKVKYFW